MIASEKIREIIEQLVLQAPENHLVDYGGQPIFNTPLVGFVNGDDPLFQSFRNCVSPNHLLPREILVKRASADADLTHVCVISWVLPFTNAIRRSNHITDEPSRLYSLARNNGGALNYKASGRLEELLQRKNIVAVSPILTHDYDAFRMPEYVFTSTWSERHVAFAAGLGYFGLNGALITPLGSNVRLGSLVMNFPVEIDPKKKDSYLAPCLKSKGKACDLCIERCPIGAISRNGIDKEKCYAMRNAIRRRHLEHFTSEMHMIPSPVVKSGKREKGYSLGCALCQCGVPCGGTDPFKA